MKIKNKGFSLIEVTIVAGIMGMMGMYMMQMTNNMQKTIQRMEIVNAEQELMYMTTLSLTDKAACGRTIAGYCQHPATKKPLKDSAGKMIITEAVCRNRADEISLNVNNVWKNRGYELKEAPSFPFKRGDLNENNSTQLIEDSESGSFGSSANSAKIYNQNYGPVFKACNVEFNIFTNTFENIPGISNAYSIEFGDGPPPVADCDDKLYYVGRELMLTKFRIVNYPEEEGGVVLDQEGGGKVKFVFEYKRLKGDKRMMMKDVDLFVKIDENNIIQNCVSANDVEVFANDATYMVYAPAICNNDAAADLSDSGACGNKITCGVSCGRNPTTGELDQMIGGDPYRPQGPEWYCDLNLGFSGLEDCSGCTDTNGEAGNNCEARCSQGIKYTSYECRGKSGDSSSGSDPSFIGCRGICVRRY